MSNPNRKLLREVIKNESSKKTKNALIFGFYSGDNLLPWEHREDFEQLVSDLNAEFRPDGRMELETIFDMAHNRWQKARLRKIWHVAAYLQPFVQHLILSGKKSIGGMRKFLRAQVGEEPNILRELRKHVKRLIKMTKDPRDFEKLAQQLEVAMNYTEEKLRPMMKALKKHENAGNTLQQIYSPEYMEPIIRIEAMLDARLDKLLSRLANLKEFKRLEASRGISLLSSPARAPARRDNDNNDVDQ